MVVWIFGVVRGRSGIKARVGDRESWRDGVQKRSAHQAVLKAKEHQRQGKRWVVDMDLAKFFDEVNHDLLIARIARKVKDWRMLTLIRRSLPVGILRDGDVQGRDKGAPGVDGMTVDELSNFMKEHWVTVKGQLLCGNYYPQPVREVELPKPGGGKRQLGIPTVVELRSKPHE